MKFDRSYQFNGSFLHLKSFTLMKKKGFKPLFATINLVDGVYSISLELSVY